MTHISASQPSPANSIAGPSPAQPASQIPDFEAVLRRVETYLDRASAGRPVSFELISKNIQTRHPHTRTKTTSLASFCKTAQVFPKSKSLREVALELFDIAEKLEPNEDESHSEHGVERARVTQGWMRIEAEERAEQLEDELEEMRDEMSTRRRGPRSSDVQGDGPQAIVVELKDGANGAAGHSGEASDERPAPVAPVAQPAIPAQSWQPPAHDPAVILYDQDVDSPLVPSTYPYQDDRARELLQNAQAFPEATSLRKTALEIFDIASKLHPHGLASDEAVNPPDDQPLENAEAERFWQMYLVSEQARHYETQMRTEADLRAEKAENQVDELKDEAKEIDEWKERAEIAEVKLEEDTWASMKRRRLEAYDEIGW
ncbi:hypothetical protein L198_01340 [Cryptococcus wingfieldii CBS 7118]|uniref:Uncharacterized protein n=1 Tax=Cryptococcus wingfieldii CBS 7118 TaxID=1295528 RepID=A0A1E3JZ05_9TREE|nr:hypothetical protein L198_01340 [Cryptococcus wingfieldii CBS 7118]ODO06108.1 hypothetical protein L198_01340 [Cryptococcus wingfieldii CBS 7118]